MAVFFLREVDLDEVSLSSAFIASALGHSFAWLLLLAITAGWFSLFGIEAGIVHKHQHPGLLIATVSIVFVLLAIPISTALILICKRLRFLTFLSVFLSWSAIGFVFALLILANRYYYNRYAYWSILPNEIWDALYVSSYFLLFPTFCYAVIRIRHTDLFSNDWVNANQRRNMLVFLPILVVGSAFLIYYSYYCSLPQYRCR